MGSIGRIDLLDNFDIIIPQNLPPSKLEWDLTKGPRLVSCDRAIRYAGWTGSVQWVPVGDFLDYPSGCLGDIREP